MKPLLLVIAGIVLGVALTVIFPPHNNEFTLRCKYIIGIHKDGVRDDLKCITEKDETVFFAGKQLTDLGDGWIIKGNDVIPSP